MIAENILSLYFDVYENDLQDIKQLNHFLYDKGDYDKVLIVLKNLLKKYSGKETRLNKFSDEQFSSINGTSSVRICDAEQSRKLNSE